MHYLIGIDIGTTNIKALMFDQNGYTIAEARRPTPTNTLDGGRAEYDPSALWIITATILNEIMSCLKNKVGTKQAANIAGLAVTGMGEAGVPLDKYGNAVYPVISWYDQRTEPYVPWWQETFGNERMFAITNLRNQDIFSLNKLLWLRENEPECFGRITRWHCIPDFIAYRLTGCSAMDHSIASRTMMFDAHRCVWSKELLNHAGIPLEILPELVPSGTRVGVIQAEQAALTGLPEGTPVFAGGHDHICGALAGGVVETGSVLDSSGTCEEVLVSYDSIEDITDLSQKGFNAGYHAAPGKFYASGGIPASGASVDWFHNQFPAKPGAVSIPGASGLLFLPHLRGSSSPQRDTVSRGAFIGIQATHTQADFQQAIYEGVAYELRLCAEGLLDCEPNRIVAIGGGTKNVDWLQIKTDVLGASIEVPEVQEATAFGAALLAGLGAKLYADYHGALQQTYRIGSRVIPRKDTRNCYDKNFLIFKSLYTTLHPINEVIGETQMVFGGL